jgi:hypothetical protein
LGEREVRGAGRGVIELAWQARSVGGEVLKSDGLDAFGHDDVRRCETLEWIVETDGPVRREFRKEIAGEDFCEGAEAQERVLSGKLVGVWGRFAIAAKKNLIVAYNDEDHARRAGTNIEVSAERTSGFEVGKG